jgi:alpha-1,4-digalacturonate transport system permease protein
MASVSNFLTATRGKRGPDFVDWFSYSYLFLGLVLMFGPAVWLGLSSFKTQAALIEFPPRLMPSGQKLMTVAGHDKPLPVFQVPKSDGGSTELVLTRRIGLQGNFVDPAMPQGDIVRAPMNSVTAVRETRYAI